MKCLLPSRKLTAQYLAFPIRLPAFGKVCPQPEVYLAKNTY
jgi:hypothetical protein